MLSESLLRFAERGDEAIPLWLTSRDDVWIRALVGQLDGFVGHTAQALDEAFESSILPMCRGIGAPRGAPSGLLRVLDPYFPTSVVAAARPSEVRQLLFEQAATRPRNEAIEATASLLGIRPDEVIPSLFADRAGERRVGKDQEVPSPSELGALYNLALLQGLVQRAVHVRVRAREHVRSVVRYAKLRGLICVCSADDAGTRIDLSGPLCLFRNTIRYGHALASFVPALLSTPGWELEASCLLRSRSDESEPPGGPPVRKRFIVRSRAGDPVARTHVLPAETDSAVERRLQRDIRRLQSGWAIDRETDAIRAGGAVFFPDFTLRRGGDRVLVEIVGYYTTAYLEHKIRTLKAAGLRNIIVCIDSSLACSEGDIAAPVVLRYSKRIDAAELIAAAERVVA